MPHPTPTVIEALSAGDLATAAELVVAHSNFAPYHLTQPALERRFQQALQAGDSLWLVRVDGRATGVAWLVGEGAFARSPYLRLIAVASGAEGRGVGSSLMEVVEGAAFDVAADLFLLVTSSNVAAQRFYQRRGFQAIGTLHDYVVPGVDEVLMRLRRP